ncbi:MAG: FMN-binding protein, partial [Clostridia bacterium]|nr:FMN-binding protein [Clostridia bacterium]
MDYFEKKQWIRIAVCTVLVLIAVLAMTGVFSGNGPLLYDPFAAEEARTSSAQATEQGFGGEVTARVALEDGKVKTLTIDTPNETEGLGKRASEEAFTEQFIGKSGPFTFGEDGIEALSGATVTSNAALKAINSAVGGEEAPEAPAEEPAEEPAAEPAEGPAGEPAAEPETAGDAIEAAEQGFGGDVTVHVTMDGDKIQALTIDTPNETAGLGQRASEAAFTDQFIGKSGPFTYGEDGIEALTGATITSNAVLKAINTAVGGETPAEPAAEPSAEPEAKEEPKAEGSNGQAYGVYRASAENAFSVVTVTASAKNGALTDVKITSEGEEGKDLLTDAIRDEWAQAILESGSAAPDAITGATLKFSAGSVQEAMTKILAEMNGENAEEPAAEVSATEETAGEPTEAPAAEEPAEAASTEPEAKEEPKAEGSNGQAYGVYRASAENAFSVVTVTASAKNGALTDVKITSEGEEGKDLLTDAIRDEWAKAILESGSAAPEAITGATLKFSAGSVQEAMTKILAEMNGETAEEPAEAPVAEMQEEPAAEENGEPASGNNDLLTLIAVSMGKEQENSYVTDYL